MGSIITVRRGLGRAGGKGMGYALPVAVGGGVTALVALAIRWFVNPAAGRGQATMVKWAPLFGHLAGTVAALTMFMMGGRTAGEKAKAGAMAFMGATAVGLYGLASDFVMKDKGGSILAAIASNGAAMAAMSAGAAAGTSGFGAIVPEYARPGLGGGTGAIVMEPVGASGRRAGTIGGVGSYGETVALSGVNTAAFGTPGFAA